MSDAMDVDTSYIPSSARQQLVPLSAVPTITTFNLNSPTLTVGPLSAAPTVTSFKQLFYDNMSPVRAERGRGDYEESVSGFTVDESPAQPCHKKRRSVSPEREEIQRNHHVLDIDSSPAPLSSPSELKLERISSGSGQSHFKKPLLSGLGAPIALNANNKRPRRPVHSAMLPPGDSPLASHVVFPTDGRNKENLAERRPSRPVLPPVRRAFSAMLPPTPMEHSMSSEDGSFEQDGPDMSSPAQAYAKRQQVKTIRRCDGTDDFRPSGGVTALVQRDNAVMKRGLRRSEERTERIAERDTPRSMYLHSNGLGGFGDNEAHGKILPCHRVKSDGLMRITSKTVSLNYYYFPALTC